MTPLTESTKCRAVFLACLLLGFGTLGAAAAPRRTFSLDGEWSFRRQNETNAWKQVAVPSVFQAHEGADWHGVGMYRKTFARPALEEKERLLIHFAAAATEADVYLNGTKIGTHLGGWTPFRFDITDQIRDIPPGKDILLEVRLDEKVGHNTQGFLPIIAPHFGGLWQSVSLLVMPETYIDDLELLAIGDATQGVLQLELPIHHAGEKAPVDVIVRHRLLGESDWKLTSFTVMPPSSPSRINVPVTDPKLWDVGQPNLYEVSIQLAGASGDGIVTRAAFREAKTRGPQFLLNGKPIQLRGLLNWGYAPPGNAPSLDPAHWKSELQFARERGFNMMKFCLWIPPKGYLEMADELGILTWMEYPTWHPTLTERFLPALEREFKEFFRYDRNHPSVLLRSLTCETGPSAELSVIQRLYDTAHAMIPGALVEDDSSWIGWNRVHDFYDDHPYGNNHTWVRTLTGFNDHILANGLKPLILGEAIAADTWPDHMELSKLIQNDNPRPWWAPGVLEDLPHWEARMARIAGEVGLPELRQESTRYGMLMRKFQMEAYRREVPYGGYVVSVIRDVPIASMGLIDYLGRPKTAPQDWAWHRDTICLLETPEDRRSFTAGETFASKILLSHFGTTTIEGELRVQLTSKAGEVVHEQVVREIRQKPGTVASIAEPEWTMPSAQSPSHFVVRVALQATNGTTIQNQWPIWVCPKAQPSSRLIFVHSSLPDSLKEGLFADAPRFSSGLTNEVVVASHFDDALCSYLEKGGRVLMMPDGQRHSFATSQQWFLRGAPYIPKSQIGSLVDRDFLLELQHFDLAGPVVRDLPHLDSFEPTLMLWDTHDQKSATLTHGIIFETRIGEGRLLVTTARHDGERNSAGAWLLAQLLQHLRSDYKPAKSLPPVVWDYAKSRLNAEQTNLVDMTWQFRPDPKNEGLSAGWQTRELQETADWTPIKVGAWWESQGHKSLDFWAWYRLWVQIPETWTARGTFLSFEGVDDVYELYVNGQLAGRGGDLAARKDALSERKSHNITPFVRPGERALIAVRVHDWFGAGGIFRPVTLGTLAFKPDLDLLK